MEIHEPNSGRAGFATFLKRGPLTKISSAAAGGAALPGISRVVPEQCYMPADLRIGATVTILGRQFLIYDCDAATRKWYTVRKTGAGGSAAGGQGRAGSVAGALRAGQLNTTCSLPCCLQAPCAAIATAAQHHAMSSPLRCLFPPSPPPPPPPPTHD